MSKSTWKSQSGYVWSLIGSAVGFANVLSFSANAYKNGGGAFLIPYAIALFLLGIPLLVLEGLIGKKWRLPLVSAYGKINGNLGKIFGWLAVFSCLTIGGFYIVLTGYSVAYTYFSASGIIPVDTKTFFLQTFLQNSSHITKFGSLSIPIFLSTLCVAIFTWFVLVRNVKDGVERMCKIFMPLLFVLISLFALIVCFLPGGLQGWIYYLTPNFSKLSNPSLWRDIFGQLFFSLSLGLGIIVGYSRHSKDSFNIPKAMFYTALGDFVVSFIAGSAIFGCLAHISHIQNIPFESLAQSDSSFEIGFIIFPQILKAFGPTLEKLIGSLFFFCIFIAGVTGVFSIVESITGNIEEEMRIKRKHAVSLALTAIMILAFFFSMGNGPHLIDALVPMVLGTNMLIGGLAMIFTFQKTVFKDKNFMLKYVASSILATILVCDLYKEMQNVGFAHVFRWVWLALALLLSYFCTKYAQRKESLEITG